MIYCYYRINKYVKTDINDGNDSYKVNKMIFQ